MGSEAAPGREERADDPGSSMNYSRAEPLFRVAPVCAGENACSTETTRIFQGKGGGRRFRLPECPAVGQLLPRPQNIIGMLVAPAPVITLLFTFDAGVIAELALLPFFHPT